MFCEVVFLFDVAVFCLFEGSGPVVGANFGAGTLFHHFVRWDYKLILISTADNRGNSCWMCTGLLYLVIEKSCYQATYLLTSY